MREGSPSTKKRASRARVSAARLSGATDALEPHALEERSQAALSRARQHAAQKTPPAALEETDERRERTVSEGKARRFGVTSSIDRYPQTELERLGGGFEEMASVELGLQARARRELSAASATLSLRPLVAAAHSLRAPITMASACSNTALLVWRAD